MHIFISGSSGFVGSALAKSKKLASLGTVIRLNRELQVDDMGSQFKNSVNCLIHCAWAGVAGRYRDDKDVQRLNEEMCSRIIKICLDNNVKRLIVFGSQAEYGILNRTRVEEDVLAPKTVYGVSKNNMHRFLQSECRVHQIQLVWLRLFDVYGPNDNPCWFIPAVITSFLKDESPELSDCTQIWDFLHIDDVVTAITALIKADLANDNTFNLCSGEEIVLRDVVEYIYNYIKPRTAIPLYGRIKARKDSVTYLNGSFEKLKKSTGWSPKYSILERLPEVVESFRNA